jgi:hypothetical protein
MRTVRSRSVGGQSHAGICEVVGRKGVGGVDVVALCLGICVAEIKAHTTHTTKHTPVTK